MFWFIITWILNESENPHIDVILVEIAVSITWQAWNYKLSAQCSVRFYKSSPTSMVHTMYLNSHQMFRDKVWGLHYLEIFLGGLESAMKKKLICIIGLSDRHLLSRKTTCLKNIPFKTRELLKCEQTIFVTDPILNWFWSNMEVIGWLKQKTLKNNIE